MPLVHPVIFTSVVSEELIEAQDWYEQEVPGLGRGFLGAVAQVIERISANPRQFPDVYKGIRRALLRRFPYALMFVVEPDGTVVVIACFHGSRDPEDWQRRV